MVRLPHFLYGLEQNSLGHSTANHICSSLSMALTIKALYLTIPSPRGPLIYSQKPRGLGLSLGGWGSPSASVAARCTPHHRGGEGFSWTSAVSAVCPPPRVGGQFSGASAVSAGCPPPPQGGRAALWGFGCLCCVSPPQGGRAALWGFSIRLGGCCNLSWEVSQLSGFQGLWAFCPSPIRVVGWHKCCLV